MIYSPINAGSEFPHLRANAILVREQGLVALVDCGGKKDAESIQRELAVQGISKSQISLIVFTHLHYDHCENIDLFNRAEIVVHWREIELLERFLAASTMEEVKSQINAHYEHVHAFFLRTMCQRYDVDRSLYAKILEDRGRLLIVDHDNYDVGKFSMIETSGHSVGHMSVYVHSERPILIAGDAILSLNSLNQQRVEKQNICWNRENQRISAERIMAGSGFVIPGHGKPFDLTFTKPCFL